MPTYTLINAKVVTPETVLEDTNITISDGRINAIGGSSQGKELDLKGDYLLPGLVDLHCDAIEKEIEPRAGVIMPMDVAIRQIDTRNLVAGITTIYHCLSFAGKELGVRDPSLSSDIIDCLYKSRADLSVKNRVHARFEVTQVGGLPYLQRLIQEKKIDLLSFMDHGEGQGQFVKREDYRDFLIKNYQLDKEEAERRIDEKAKTRHQAEEAISLLTKESQRLNIPLASHDDDSLEKVDQMHALGVVASEFPINEMAAQHARSLGMMTMAGAPNVLRGRSQGNGMSALSAIQAGVINVLASDYLPNALLPAAFKVHEVLKMPLPQAIQLVTANPAGIQLDQKFGKIAEGYVADLITVKYKGNQPVVTRVWVDGEQVLRRI